MEEESKDRDNICKLAIEGSSNGIYVFQDGKFKFVNEALSKISGYSREELKKMNFLDLVHPDYREEIKKWTEQALNGDLSGLPEKHEFEVLMKDGDSAWVQLIPSLVEYEERPAIVGDVVDITERRRAEEREDFLHSLLRHDLRNKAQVVQGYLELMRDFDLNEEAERFLDNAVNALTGGIEIIDKVRTVREVGKEKLGKISIDAVLEDIAVNKKPQASKEGIELEVENFDCDALGGKLLAELFSNLIENSIQHAQCDKIEISGRKTKDECIVTIQDDGKGIPDDIKDEIFDRGFKRGKTGGSGLGLYLVKEIADSYEGSVEVKDSELGGARFDVHLKKA